jgi:hypothetical protein
MNDDAVAPVIAVMLILAAVVTFLVIWNGIYVPSMKQGAEVGHLQNVESAFQHFSSDIERGVAAGQDRMILSEPVQLGGGDFFFNTLKSGGSLSVTDEAVPPYNLALYKQMDPNPVMTMKGTLVTISYNSVGNFWQDQGYHWQYGFLHVTKYGTKQSPLSYYNMTDVNNGFANEGSLGSFAGSFGDVQYTLNQTLFPDMDINGNITSYSPRAGNCSSVVLRAVNLTVSPDHPFASGNGFGKLELKSTVTSVPYPDVTEIILGSDGGPFGNATLNGWNTTLTDIDGQCENIQYVDGPIAYRMYRFDQELSPVNVTLNIVNIEVGAY